MNIKVGSWKEGPLSPALSAGKGRKVKEKLTCLADGKTEEISWQDLRADFVNINVLKFGPAYLKKLSQWSDGYSNHIRTSD